MSRLDDVLTDMGSTLFCKGQDWKKGDGSASEVDSVCDKAKAEAKALMTELIDKAIPPVPTGLDNKELIDYYDGVHYARERIRKEIEEL